MSLVGPGSAFPLVALIPVPDLYHSTMTVPAPGFVPDNTVRSCQRLRSFILHRSALDLLVESFFTNMPRLHHFETPTNDLCLAAEFQGAWLCHRALTATPGGAAPPHVNILLNLETFVVTELCIFEPFFNREKRKDDTLAKVAASRWTEELEFEEEESAWEKFKSLKKLKRIICTERCVMVPRGF
ncbi:hypothetical protein DL96DRAFT_497997 [Flagelloscypha sp. PMI_526]|nr:hypothetical protein DL96DRAFT_497997 [Flagelloscypha sp. PMI_526]